MDRGILVTVGPMYGKPGALICDARCDKAWGINNRPRVEHDPDDPDDISFKSDDELGEAPDDPGTYEGGEGKPQTDEQRHNKWCLRECERSEVCPTAGGDGEREEINPFQLQEGRAHNQPWKHRDDVPHPDNEQE